MTNINDTDIYLESWPIASEGGNNGWTRVTWTHYGNLVGVWEGKLLRSFVMTAIKAIDAIEMSGPDVAGPRWPNNKQLQERITSWNAGGQRKHLKLVEVKGAAIKVEGVDCYTRLTFSR